MNAKNKSVKAAKKQTPLPPSKPSQSAKKPAQRVPVKTAPKSPPKPVQKVTAAPVEKPKKTLIIKRSAPAAPVVEMAPSVMTPELKEKMKREFEEAIKVEVNARDLQELPIISFYRTTGFLEKMRNTKL